MNFSKLTLAVASLLGASASSGAFALDLYVDTRTKQLYAEPGPGRERLGSFQRVEDAPAKTEAKASQTEAELAAIREDLELKANELKAEHVKKPEEKAAMAAKGILPAGVSYGKKGFEFKTDDGKFSLAIQNRLQFRYATPFDRDPRSISDLEQDSSSFMIRRARTKLYGNLYWPFPNIICSMTGLSLCCVI